MNSHLPPLSALRAFEAAARHMSFSKAADELHVTPAAISHQIHALEEDLGIRLFHRMNRSIELTASARVLLPGLTEAFAGIQSSVRRLRAHNDTGTLTVTASPSFAAKWLVLRLHRFQEQCTPRSMCGFPRPTTVVDLTKGDFDIAIRYGARQLSGARRRAVVHERGVSGLQPAVADQRARRCARPMICLATRSDPRSGRRARPAGRRPGRCG